MNTNTLPPAATAYPLRQALRDWLATLAARYDSGVMRDAPAPAQPPKDTGHSEAERRTEAALRAWCERGMGSGRAPLWRPWALPDLPERLSLARLPAADADAQGLAPGGLAALMRRLDRNAELDEQAARSRLAGLRLRLLVKWRELRWWRARHPQQPWDSGYLLGAPESLARLAAFRPRRPTLLVAQGLPEAGLAQALRSLQAAQPRYRHPVRLLLLDPLPPGCAPAGQPLTVIGPAPGAAAHSERPRLASQSPPA